MKVLIEPTILFSDDWQQLLAMLPNNRDAMAKENGALQRRREIQDADTLLRIALAYSWLGLSLRNTAAWAAQCGAAKLSDVAVLKQLRHASDFLKQLVSETMQLHTNVKQLQSCGFSVQIVDASVITEPGSVGTDWRVHLGIDLASLRITEVDITDAGGGESFTRFEGAPNRIIVGDRGYSHRRGIAHIASAGGHILVRLNWNNVPLQNKDGTPFDLFGALGSLADGQVGDWAVQTAPDPKAGIPAVPGRVTAMRKNKDAAETARRNVKKEAKRKGKTPDARTLQAADYIFMFTTVSEEDFSAHAVLELYRFRWQIELAFKRFKSLLGMGGLKAHDPALCRTYLYSKLLAALLIEDLSSRPDFSPWEVEDNTPDFDVAADPDDVVHLVPGCS